MAKNKITSQVSRHVWVNICTRACGQDPAGKDLLQAERITRAVSQLVCLKVTCNVMEALNGAPRLSPRPDDRSVAQSPSTVQDDRRHVVVLRGVRGDRGYLHTQGRVMNRQRGAYVFMIKKRRKAIGWSEESWPRRWMRKWTRPKKQVFCCPLEACLQRKDIITHIRTPNVCK